MAQFQIGVVVGSLRRDSFNRKLADGLVRLGPADFSFKHLQIDDLPFYNQDDDANQAPSVKRLKSEIAACQGILFVTPEYNRSMPGVFKNALDIASRPLAVNAWDGKPGAIASVSPGAAGAFGATHHLRQSLIGLNVAAMPQPEVYLGHASDLFAADGSIANERTRGYVAKFLVAFSTWIDRFA